MFPRLAPPLLLSTWIPAHPRCYFILSSTLSQNGVKGSIIKVLSRLSPVPNHKYIFLWISESPKTESKEEFDALGKFCIRHFGEPTSFSLKGKVSLLSLKCNRLVSGQHPTVSHLLYLMVSLCRNTLLCSRTLVKTQIVWAVCTQNLLFLNTLGIYYAWC